MPAPAPSDDTTEALVKVTTSYGSMTIRLYNATPLHRDNFLKLVKQGYYDSLLFHRVIKDFMIQGGDPESKKAAPGVMLGQGGPGYTVPAEIKSDIFHKKGALAAARTGDAVNPAKASSGSQFYLVQGKVYPLSELNGMEQRFGIRFTEKQKELYSTVGGTPHLDGAYTVYGEVTEGLAVIDAIASVQTGAGDRPVKDISMKMEVIRDYTPAK
ncbi:MAG: peptidylprolyl isomerase [Bacteroidales bacterium]